MHLKVFLLRQNTMPPSKNAENARRKAAQIRIAAAFRGHLARRPINATTLNAIPGRRRVQLGAHAHDASSIAELVRRGNWRDPLTRTPLTNAQAAAVWRLHVRNEAAEARREGRHYVAPPMPQRPAVGAINSHRLGNIYQWYHGGNGSYHHPHMAAMAAVAAVATRGPAFPWPNSQATGAMSSRRQDQTAAKSAAKRGWTAILRSEPSWLWTFNPQLPGRSEWRGQRFRLTRFIHDNQETSWKFTDNGRNIALFAVVSGSDRVWVIMEPQLQDDWEQWKQDMQQYLTTSLRHARARVQARR